MSAPVIQIENFNENNNDTWCIQSRSNLIQNGFWKIVSSGVKKLTGDEDISVWKSINEKFLAYIILCMKLTQSYYIRNSIASHWIKYISPIMDRNSGRNFSLFFCIVNYNFPRFFPVEKKVCFPQ